MFFSKLSVILSMLRKLAFALFLFRVLGRYQASSRRLEVRRTHQLYHKAPAAPCALLAAFERHFLHHSGGLGWPLREPSNQGT